MYEAFFRLRDAPFRLTPDPHFLYLSAKHAEALAHLRLGLTEPGGFVCITGDIGTGKTTVLRTFLADLGPDVATAFVFNPTLSWEDLLHRIARELGVPVAGGSHVDAMDALNAHLLAQRKEGRISVVVIDEAQAMALEVLERLRLLSNLETSTEKLVRLVLVGQPQLARLLLDPALAQLNQRITLRWHLRPLRRAETYAYVRHRLGVAGGEDAVRLFTRPALRLIHRYSGGVPRLVNMIAHRAMLAAYVKRGRRVGMGAVREAYREIRAVPLASVSIVRRVAWTASAAAAVIALATAGLPRLRPVLERVARRSVPIVAAPEDASAVAAPAPPPTIAPPVEMAPARPAPAIEVAAARPALPADAATPAPPVEAAPPKPAAPPVVATPAPEPTVPFERRLARLAPEHTFRDAIDTIFAAWRVQALRPGETPSHASLETIAHARNLEDLRLTGNLSMLRLLNLPAVLEIRLPGTTDPHFVTLAGIGDDAARLVVGGETVRVSPADLDRVWFGDAHVLWRDFEWLGPTFGTEGKGEPVARLQRVLARAGLYPGKPTGTFDQATRDAVLKFQRSRRLDADCRVGRLTRIALYAAAGTYRAPSLASDDTGTAAIGASRGPS